MLQYEHFEHCIFALISVDIQLKYICNLCALFLLSPFIAKFFYKKIFVYLSDVYLKWGFVKWLSTFWNILRGFLLWERFFNQNLVNRFSFFFFSSCLWALIPPLHFTLKKHHFSLLNWKICVAVRKIRIPKMKYVSSHFSFLSHFFFSENK